MAYATIDDIQGEFKDGVNLFGTGTFVTASTITNKFIPQADALINSYLGSRYSTPVSTPLESLELLRMYSTIIVAARVKAIIEVKQVTNTDANQAARGNFMSVSDVMKNLKDIRDGNADFPGGNLLTPQGGMFSYNYANDVEPVFRKDEKQW